MTIPTARHSLGTSSLVDLAGAQRPLVDPATCRPRVVHFGIGAFHRAHQAVYTEAAAARSGEPWGIAAVAPGSRTAVTGLRAQDCLYSVTELAAAGNSTRVVGSITDALLLGADSARVDELLRSRGGQRGHADGHREGLPPAGRQRAAGHHGPRDRRRPRPSGDTATAANDLGTVVGRIAASLGRPVPGRARPRSASCPATTWPATEPRWPASSAALCRPPNGPTRTPCWTGCPPRSPSRPPWSTGSCRPPPTPTGTPLPPRSACGTRWPWSGSPTGNGCWRTPSPGRGRRGNSTARCSSPTSRRTS